MIIRFDDSIVMRDNDLVTTDDRDDISSARQLDVFDLSADNL